MSGIGKFKLTDALPKSTGDLPDDAGPVSLGDKGGGKAKPRSKKAKTGKAGQEQSAEQIREARESARAKNAEASPRGHMVDIGRGNQQAGRQKAK